VNAFMTRLYQIVSTFWIDPLAYGPQSAPYLSST